MQFIGCVRIACVAVCLLAACAPTGSSNKNPGAFNASAREAASDQSSSVAGTTLDAATGDALANVEVKGPGGVHAKSDKDGRFVLEGLAPGTTGEVEALAHDGRKARATLRPLAAGRLEIVLHLK
jgi:erythromycin esterase-like protein